MKQTRPPIVVIMGHVDHGKTTLLDYILKTNVAGKEAGGITQSIGAYEITHPSTSSGQAPKKITFIDTPGHEAFSKMRERGAKVADLAILVVAADDSVKPQTKNALKYIEEEKLPYVVAINKIDKPGANIDQVANDLMQLGVFLEGKGGNVSWHGISAKTGEGVNDLLDLLLLSSELEDIHCVGKDVASGVVISVKMDPRRGIVASVIIKDGVLKQGSAIATHSAKGRVKMLENFKGVAAKELVPSAPAAIIGFETAPQIGEVFCAHTDEIALRAALEEFEKTIPQIARKADVSIAKEKHLPVFLKADEAGSLEVLVEVTHKLMETLPLSIIKTGVGPITESDVKDAESMKAIIVGFRAKADRVAENLMMVKKINMLNSPIIYELEKQMKEYAEKYATKEYRTLEILGVFGAPKGKERVVGGRILLGPVKNHESFEIWHDTRMLGKGRIINLQSGKKDVAEAPTDVEVGMLVDSEDSIRIGDKLIFA